ncbi:hypothetical protein [Bacteroides finegoldii]|uniref:hypothetical protein n=1 Tax=Bacteroides finegoldii TaxID=338188 RepID=UPI0001842BDE|nr:hypothetical protein [Bacteroides finegoldii]EEX46651.1 hypothetical protein BACFIN_05687 [Bacteroides finegoldii DSM 17565]
MKRNLYCAIGGLLLFFAACSEEEKSPSFTILVQDLQRNSATVTGTPPKAESEAGKTTVYNDCGIYWSDTNPNPTDADRRVTAQPDANGNFRISLTELKGATTYYVKGYARDYSKTLESEAISFTTPGGNPQFCIRVAFPGECHVTIIDLGGKEIKETGLCGVIVSDAPSDFMPDINNSMREPQTPFWKNNDKTAFTMTIPFNGNVPDSYAKQTYYVRAYIITENGIGYSDRFTYKSFDR